MTKEADENVLLWLENVNTLFKEKKMKLRVLLIVACISLVGLAGISTADMNQQKQAGSQARLRATQLSETDAANIQYMRQEEKLARDVYLTLYEEWGAPIFANIGESEQQHMDALKNLIDLYQIEDPIADNSVGAFTDPDFTVLYEYYVDLGMPSLLDAFDVGVQIEQLDIADLDTRIAETTMRNVIRVFENLRAGSERHLAAFESHIDNYDPECQENCDGTGTQIQQRDRDGSCINQ